VKSTLVSVCDDKTDILVTGDNSLHLPDLHTEQKAIAVFGQVKPSLQSRSSSKNKSKLYTALDDELSHPISFQYEVPFTKDPKKSHSKKIEDQYKRKIQIFVKYNFPSMFVRQEVCNRKIQVLSPIEVATDDIEERVAEMNRLLGKKKYEQTDLRDMMRVMQGSIMPQVNAGAAEVVKIFLGDVASEIPFSQQNKFKVLTI